jgi:hypothetical protein
MPSKNLFRISRQPMQVSQLLSGVRHAVTKESHDQAGYLAVTRRCAALGIMSVRSLCRNAGVSDVQPTLTCVAGTERRSVIAASRPKAVVGILICPR